MKSTINIYGAGLAGCEGMRPASDRARISPLRPVGYYEADDTPTIPYTLKKTVCWKYSTLKTNLKLIRT